MNTGQKVAATVGLAVALIVLSVFIRYCIRRALHPDPGSRFRFWSQQTIHLVVLAAFIVGAVVIWAEDLPKAGSVLALVTAGIAVALQRVITAFAAYLIILRGRLFTVGDRITMGHVRGDVVALGFMQTTVMEIRRPPGCTRANTRGGLCGSRTTRSSTRLCTTTRASFRSSGKR